MSKTSRTLSLSISVLLVLSAYVYLTLPGAAAMQSNSAPDLSELDNSKSELRSVIERYVADRGSLLRSYPVENSLLRQTRLKQFYRDWLAQLSKLNFEALSQDGKVDYVLFKNHLEHELKQREIEGKALTEIAPLLPFAQPIAELAEARRRMEKIDAQKIATQLNDLHKQIETTHRSLESSLRSEPGKVKRTSAVALSTSCPTRLTSKSIHCCGVIFSR